MCFSLGIVRNWKITFLSKSKCKFSSCNFWMEPFRILECRANYIRFISWHIKRHMSDELNNQSWIENLWWHSINLIKSFTFLLNENFAMNDKFILTRTKVHWINLQCCDKGLNKFLNKFSTKLYKYRIFSVMKTTCVFQSWMNRKKTEGTVNL